MSNVVCLLVSTDERLIQTISAETSSLAPLRVLTVPSCDAAGDRLDDQHLALVIVHLGDVPDMVGAGSLIQALAAAERPIAVIVINERDRPKEAFTLVRQGAAHVLSRPLNVPFLVHRIDVLTSQARYESLSKFGAKKESEVLSLGEGEDGFLFHPDEMGDMMDKVRRVAPQETTVLLNGESGTGKTRLARLIHELSDRRNEPFMQVNCGALSSTLIESELFGHLRGAFTDADRDRNGKFFDVGRGTLLLDEIDTLPISSQVKLLKAVEERTFEPVGSNKSYPMKARLIAASIRRLEDEVREGRFRSDLYYRLNVVSFRLPSLRERPQLIRRLAEKFVAEFAARNRRDVFGVAPEAMESLRGYDWPGNIRQLRNVIESALALCPGSRIERSDLPYDIVAAASGEPPTVCEDKDEPDAPTLAEIKGVAEYDRIRQALQNNGDNKQKTAKELGISRVTLYKKLRRYGLLE